MPRVIALCWCMVGGCFDPKLAFDNGELTCTQTCPPSYVCIQGAQNFCCRMDPPFFCTTVQQCNL